MLPSPDTACIEIPRSGGGDDYSVLESSQRQDLAYASNNLSDLNLI